MQPSVDGAPAMSRSPTPMNLSPYHHMDEEQKELFKISVKLKFEAQLFKNNEFLQKALASFYDFTIIKYPRIW